MTRKPRKKVSSEWNNYIFKDCKYHCLLCGQKRLSNTWICPNCIKYQEEFILFVCRDLMFKYGKTTYTENGTAEKTLQILSDPFGQPKNIDKTELNEMQDDSIQDSDNETPAAALAIFFILDHFAVHASSLSVKNQNKLMTYGSWFAHIMAYRVVESMLIDAKIPNALEVVNHHCFTFIRNNIFEAMKKYQPRKEYYLNTKKRTSTEELLENFFTTGESKKTMRCYILRMITDLAKSGKINLDLHLALDRSTNSRQTIIDCGGLNNKCLPSCKRHCTRMFNTKKSD